MKESEEGRLILKERPIVDETMFKNAQAYKPCSFGRAYVDFLKEQNITFERPPIEYINDHDLKYVMLRYRQIHDFLHVLTGLDISVENEIVLKWFEFVQNGLPVAGLSSVFGPLSLQSNQRKGLLKKISWAIQQGLMSKNLMNVYFEKYFDLELNELRSNLNIVPFK